MNKVVNATKPSHRRQTKAYRAFYEERSSELDPITEFARRYCHTPFAGDSVVDNDQVLLKSRVGRSIDRLSRSGAFWKMDRVPRPLGRRQRQLLVAMSQHVAAVLGLLYEDHATGLLNRQGFLAALPPLIDLAADRISGFEVFARWQAPGGKHVQLPEVFLPAFEIAEYLQELDWVIVDQVCAHLRRCLDCGLAVPRLLCNLSGTTIGQAGFLTVVDRVLVRHLVSSHGIGFALTESHLQREPVRARVFLDALRASGIYPALDDFGSGHSNLLALRDWPVDCIKVERSFVRAVDTDTKSQDLLHLLLDMSRSLGGAVVCEGVEIEAHLDWLSAAGSSHLQGWYFAEALSADLVPRLATLFAKDGDLGNTLRRRARFLAASTHNAVGVPLA